MKETLRMSRRSTRQSRPMTAPRPSRLTSAWLRPRLERLEDRTVPAAVAWDGGPTGNSTNWLDPTNWAGDDVTIGATGSSPAINLAGATAVNSVTSSRAIGVSGALTINDANGRTSTF